MISVLFSSHCLLVSSLSKGMTLTKRLYCVIHLQKLKDESSFGSEGVCAVAFGTEWKAHNKMKCLR